MGLFCGVGCVVGFYFLVYWCFLCRNFILLLIDFYKNWKKFGDNLEIVFVSWDKDEVSFKEYFFFMFWMVVLFDLKKKVRWIK